MLAEAYDSKLALLRRPGIKRFEDNLSEKAHSALDAYRVEIVQRRPREITQVSKLANVDCTGFLFGCFSYIQPDENSMDPCPWFPLSLPYSIFWNSLLPRCAVNVDVSLR